MTRGPDDHLYARVLGAAWDELAPAVRSVHTPGGEKCGEFRITHGERRMARVLARWVGLPRPAILAGTLLRIVEDGDRQRWERLFDGKPMVTMQWAGGPGCLMERIGAWEFCFRLRVNEGALFYEQTRRPRFRLGPLRVPVPWGPEVVASETPDGAARVRVSVQVRLPGLGRLIAYDGWLGVEAPVS